MGKRTSFSSLAGPLPKKFARHVVQVYFARSAIMKLYYNDQQYSGTVLLLLGGLLEASKAGILGPIGIPGGWACDCDCGTGVGAAPATALPF